MQRPGPLRDIPLDRINFADNVSHPVSFKQRPNKRPLSPNASPVSTPAKRQIVSPDAAGPSEIGSQSMLWSSTDDQSTPVRVRDALPGLSLTPRKLDFSVAEADDDAYGSPMKCTPPSPARPAAPSLSPDAMDVDDCFTPTHSLTSPLLEPANLAAADRSSIHYPGFDVHLDPDGAGVEPSSSLLQTPSVGPSNSKKAKEQDKENVPPPRVKTPRVGKEEALAKAAVVASMKAAGAEIENWSPCAPDEGYISSPKPRLNPHQLVSRGQSVPWLTPERARSSNALKPLSTRLLEIGSEEVEWEEDM